MEIKDEKTMKNLLNLNNVVSLSFYPRNLEAWGTFSYTNNQ